METKRARKKNLKVRKISTKKKRRLRIVIGFIHSFGRSVGRTHLHHMFDEKRQHQQLGHNYSLTIIISVLIITINLISSSNWTIQMRYHVKCHIYKKNKIKNSHIRRMILLWLYLWIKSNGGQISIKRR